MSLYLSRIVDILCNLLIEYLQTLSYSLMFDTAKCGRRRKSIVRVIGTLLPLPKAPRVYFNLAAWRHTLPGDDSSSETVSVIEESERNVDSVDLQLRIPGEIVINQEKTIKHLQDELQELKIQVALILQNQQNLTVAGGNLHNLEKKLDEERAAIPTPPPPPPLPPIPPPMPPPRIELSKVSLRPAVSRYANQPSAIDAIISEMKRGRPKLKPVARSPGGRPLKRPTTPVADPGDTLTEVLRRRFSMSQFSDTTNDSISDVSSNFTTDIQSPDWMTQFT